MVTNISKVFGDVQPAPLTAAYLEEAEQLLVDSAYDLASIVLVVYLRRQGGHIHFSRASLGSKKCHGA